MSTAATGAAATVYLDSSALVKLVQVERESAALRRYLRRHRSLVRATCALARVEVVRAVAPPTAHLLRSLDAIHLAAAQTLPGLQAVVTYGPRMQAAAAALGLPVDAPA